MIRDTDWLEELRNDPSLYYLQKLTWVLVTKFSRNGQSVV